MIIIVDYNGSFSYSLYQSVVKVHPNVEVIDNRILDLEDIKKMHPEGIILSSGPGLPNNLHQEVEIVRKYSSSIPILGISFGHLAIGAAYGAEVVHVSEMEHGKTRIVVYKEDELFEGLPNPFEAGFFHTHILSHRNFPHQLKILAESDKGDIMCIKHKEHPCYGVQFYPDSLLTPQGDLILANFCTILGTVHKK